MPRRRLKPWEVAEVTAAQIAPLNADDDRTAAFCPICRARILSFEDCQLDHITPLELCGKDEPGNLQWVHRSCHRSKTKTDQGRIAKAKRVAGETGQRARRDRRGGSSIKSRGFDKIHKEQLERRRLIPSRSFDTRYRKKFNGDVERRQP